MSLGYKAYEDSNFQAGDSPFVADIIADLGRPAEDGYIACDGGGDIQVNLALRDTTYGDTFTMKKGEMYSLILLNVWKIKLTHTGVDSAYRINLK
jgi:hypothetical protein